MKKKQVIKMELKCDECGGRIVRKKVDYLFLGENLGKFDAKVCAKCGETLFEEDASRKITEVAKAKGLWNLSAKAKVGKVGGSIAVTINKKIAEFIKLKKGEEVRVYPENKNRIVIETI